MATGDVDQRIRDTQREYAEFLDDYVRPVDSLYYFYSFDSFNLDLHAESRWNLYSAS